METKIGFQSITKCYSIQHLFSHCYDVILEQGISKLSDIKDDDGGMKGYYCISRTLIDPWLFAATITGEPFFQATADTNSVLSSAAGRCNIF